MHEHNFFYLVAVFVCARKPAPDISGNKSGLAKVSLESDAPPPTFLLWDDVNFAEKDGDNASVSQPPPPTVSTPRPHRTSTSPWLGSPGIAGNG